MKAYARHRKSSTSRLVRAGIVRWARKARPWLKELW